MGVLVNDMAEINVDADLVRGGGGRSSLKGDGGAEGGVVELTNGCICCTLREDFLSELAGIIASRGLDCVVVESSGVSEPMPVAAAFAVEGPSGGRLGDFAQVSPKPQALNPQPSNLNPHPSTPYPQPSTPIIPAQLDNMLTVVDASDLQVALFSAARAEGSGGGGEEGERTIADLMADQVEFADTILLNKCDLITSERAGAPGGWSPKP